MKDISLDDLIKQDKQKNKLKKSNTSSRRFDPRHRPRPTFNTRPSQKQTITSRNYRIPSIKNHRSSTTRPIQKHRQRRIKRFNRIDRDGDRPRQNQRKRQAQRTERQSNENKQQAPKQEKGRTLRVLGLHPDITNQDLYKLFAAQGALQKCMIEQDNFGRNLPSAIVKYYAAETAKQAISNINSKKVMNSVLTVQPYRHNRK